MLYLETFWQSFCKVYETSSKVWSTAKQKNFLYKISQKYKVYYYTFIRFVHVITFTEF